MKLIRAITVKFNDDDLRFVENRARQMGMESCAEYIRHLVTTDKETAEHSFSLLADALGIKVSVDYLENHEGSV